MYTLPTWFCQSSTSTATCCLFRQIPGQRTRTCSHTCPTRLRHPVALKACQPQVGTLCLASLKKAWQTNYEESAHDEEQPISVAGSTSCFAWPWSDLRRAPAFWPQRLQISSYTYIYIRKYGGSFIAVWGDVRQVWCGCYRHVSHESLGKGSQGNPIRPMRDD